MALLKTTYNRRSFLKVSAASGGGFVLGFNWLASCTPGEVVREIPSEWFDVNAFLKIAENGMVTIMSPNPEIGQNVKTSMPMVVAEELDVNWNDVIVEQAPLNTDVFERQVAGGSQSIRRGWNSLRMAGATAKQMLINAAAKKWEVDPASCTASKGYITSGKNKISYGEVAKDAANQEVPEEVPLKDPKNFILIGSDVRNVDTDQIIGGKPLFGIDTQKEGMQYAVVLRPPAFGTKLKGFNDTDAKAVNGVNDVIQFGNKVAVLASSTWAAIKGKNALRAEWEKDGDLESTEYHNKEMLRLLDTKSDEPKRKDGNPEMAFKNADNIFEKTYEAPFLPHNTLEPMNFYADVTPEKADFLGPIQTPEWTRRRISELLEMKEDKIHIMLTRMGGGFGRRLYGDFALEAAEVSKLAKTPIQLVFTREDDMTAGTYRPASKYKFRAAIKEGSITGYHLTGVGVNMGNSTRQDNFPAGAIQNYFIESHNLESNITTGAWRAPITNFLAFAEQSFFDELAGELDIDPVKLRLDLFEVAKNSGAEFDYDVDKSVGVIKLAAEKSNWGNAPNGVYQGFSTYYSHNTYVAEVAEVVMEGGSPKVKKVIAAIDCGIVINPIAAKNQVEGGIIDGIGHAMYGNLTFNNGQPQQNNFNNYRLIRMDEAPPEVEIHFVKNYDDPTGLGEPSLPPAGGAIANAIAAATGERMYSQPFKGGQSIDLG